MDSIQAESQSFYSQAQLAVSPSEESVTATSQMYLQKQLIIIIQQSIFFVSNLGISAAAAAILKITWKRCYKRSNQHNEYSRILFRQAGLLLSYWSGTVQSYLL